MTDYYLEPALGNDSNLGTSWGAGNSWATLQKAADAAVAGDTVYCKGTEVLALSVDFDQNGGDNTTGFIKFIGVNSSGVNDGTRYIVDCDKDNTNINGLVFGNVSSFVWFENIEVKDSDNDGVTHSGTTTTYSVWINCAFHGHGAFGFDGYRFTKSYFFRCAFYNNTNDGLYINAYCSLFFCSAHDNNARGFDFVYSSYSTAIGCLAYGNTSDGFGMLPYNFDLYGCTTDGNGADGVSIYQYGPCIVGCRITNHSGAGDIGIDASDDMILYGWNYFENNTGDNIQNGSLAYPISHNGAAINIEDQSDTNQGYTDLTNDSEDFSLRSDASLRRQPITIPLV